MKLLYKFINSGIRPSYSEFQKTRIRIVNAGGAVGILLIGLLGLISLHQGNLRDFALHLARCGTLAAVLLLNRRGRHGAAAYLLILGLAALTFIGVFLSPVLGTGNYMLLALIAASFLVLEKPGQGLAPALSILIALILLQYIQHERSIQEFDVIFVMEMLFIVACYTLILFIEKWESRKSRVELEETRELLQTAEEIDGSGSWEWEPDSGIFRHSPQWTRLHGLNRRLFRLRELFRIVLSDDRSRLNAFWKDIKGGLDSGEIEYRIVRPDDGRLRNILLRIRVIEGTKSPKKLFGISRDITEQLEKNSELINLWAIVERIPASILITDSGGKIIYVNPFFEKLTGFSREDALNQNPRILKSGEQDKEFYRRMWDSILAGQTWRGEFHNRKKNGELYWEDATISPVTDATGTITHFIAVKEDITAKKKHEEMLQRALAEFQAIFDNSAVGIIEISSNGLIRRANRRFQEIFLQSDGDIAERNIFALLEQYSCIEELLMDNLPALFRGEIIHTEAHFNPGTEREIHCSIYGRLVESTEVKGGTILIFDDITARKKMEKLREDVDRIMIHDLKNPLNAIIGLPQLMLEESGLTPAQEKILRMIGQAGYRMLNMINQSLDLYKIEMGTFLYQPRPVDFQKLIRNVIENLNVMARGVGVAISAFGDGIPLEECRPIVFPADDMLTFTMISNVLSNAIQASNRGDVVTIHLRYQDEMLITIHNQGVIPVAIRPVFFEKYSTFGKTRGTGLGTYSAQLIARAQGGEISFQSSEQEGTTLLIRLPDSESRNEFPAASDRDRFDEEYQL